MEKYRDLNLKINKMKVSFSYLDPNTDILEIKFGNNFSIKFKVKITDVFENEWYRSGCYLFVNEKTGYEYVSEESDLISAKNEFFEGLLSYIMVAAKEKKLFRYLDNWGFKFNSLIGGYE